MAIKTNCPHCDEAYTIADEQAGKKVRCKTCTTVFEVPVADEGRQETLSTDAPPRTARRDEDENCDDRPRRSRRSQSGTPVWVWFAIGGGVLLVLLLVGGVIVLFTTGVLGNKVTYENFQKLKWGMSEAEVKAILGPPTEVSDLQTFFGNNPLQLPGQQPFPLGGNLRVLVWKHRENYISVMFTDGKATNIAGTFGNSPLRAPSH
jgi:predicted Zn finger-like uncharacterized protein